MGINLSKPTNVIVGKRGRKNVRDLSAKARRSCMFVSFDGTYQTSPAAVKQHETSMNKPECNSLLLRNIRTSMKMFRFYDKKTKERIDTELMDAHHIKPRCEGGVVVAENISLMTIEKHRKITNRQNSAYAHGSHYNDKSSSISRQFSVDQLEFFRRFSGSSLIFQNKNPVALKNRILKDMKIDNMNFDVYI